MFYDVSYHKSLSLDECQQREYGYNHKNQYSDNLSNIDDAHNEL